ncbi:MAG: tetratricopeptide repeat protein [Opitutus sp.]
MPALLASSPYSAARSLLEEARVLANQGDHAAAVSLVSRVLKENPSSFEAHILLGEFSLATPHGGGGAEKMFQNALVLRPGNQLAQRSLAEALFVQGKLKAAAEYLLPVVGKHPNDTKALFLLAKVAAKFGNDGAAEAALRQALMYEPRNASVLASLAEMLRTKGQLDEANEVLGRVEKADTLDSGSILRLAQIREHQNKPDFAEKLLREGLRRFPDSTETAIALGDLLKRKGALTEALVMHRHAAGAPIAELPKVNRERRRALFLVQTGSSWQSLASIYEQFRTDPNWDAVVVAVPFIHCHFTTDDERNAVFEFLRNEGITYVRWDEFALSVGCADIAFFYIPYDETLPAGWRLNDFLRCVPRIIYVPYALVIVGGTENTQSQFNLPLQQRAWLVVAHSARNRALYARHCLTGCAHVEVTGHPKMDALRRLSAFIDPEITAFASGRKVVCWNPHFDYRPNETAFGSGLSTFLRWKDFLLAEFSLRRELALVIRPHPLFFSSLNTRGFWRDTHAQEFEARIRESGNVMIDRRPSYLPVFASAVAMISDASSLLLEFAVTGKPLLYLRNPHGPELDDHGELVRDHLYTATQESEIREFLDLVTQAEDPRRPARLNAMGDFVYQPAEGADLAVKRAIERRLEQELTVT